MKKKTLEKLTNYMIPENGTKQFANKENLVHSSLKSPSRRSIFLLMQEFGTRPNYNNKTFLTMFQAMKLVRKGYKDLKKNPIHYKTKATPEFINSLKQYMKSLGILDISFVKVPKEYIFKNHAILHDNAIVFTLEMNQAIVATSPSKACGQEIFDTYKKTGEMTNKIAQFLRKHGYSAQANAGMGGDVLFPLLGEKAGLGYRGLSDLLISPKVGPRQRLAAVFTSIENLPFYTEENPHQWIREFCDRCNRCVRVCPESALQNPPIEDKYKRCAKAFSDLHGCSLCMKECVFNLHPYEKIKKGYERRQKSL